MKKIIIILAIATLFGCNNAIKYPMTYHTTSGNITYINDSIVVIVTHISGIDNYGTNIINLKELKERYNHE